jgi:hypothetical protein
VVQESDRTHGPRDFVIQQDSPETPRHYGEARQESSRSEPTCHKSQSEHDWAYAKRALARGDNPEVVIQRIADYRSEDKDDPNYYARHTVAKAQAHLPIERHNPGTSGVSESPHADKEPDH